MGLTVDWFDSVSLPPVPSMKGMADEGKTAAIEFCTVGGALQSLGTSST